MSKSAKAADSNLSGTIKVNFDDIFNSASWKRARKEALSHNPLKGAKRIAKVPPAPASPNHGPKATHRLAKKADFFVGKLDNKKVAEAKAKPKAPKQAPVEKAKVHADSGPHLDYFKSKAFLKARREALAYDPLKKPHIPKAPPASLSLHKSVVADSKMVKGKRAALAKPQPSLVATYVARPGYNPEFSPARVVKNQAQVSELVRKGNLDLLSAVAYCDPRGAIHTGSVMEIYSLLPAA